jgi:hypothetical protein
MEAVGVSWLGAANALAFFLNWIVNLGGSIVALVLFVRHRHPASLLAVVGFGLPALIAPVITFSQSFVAERAGVGGLAVLTSINGLLSFVATLALVIAVWLALRDRHVREDEQV